jgi:hypothetical protein
MHPKAAGSFVEGEGRSENFAKLLLQTGLLFVMVFLTTGLFRLNIFICILAFELL